ncbi:MAG: hypothetical protein ACRC6B_12050, partial [Fusobacteriaceae bacterium]
SGALGSAGNAISGLFGGGKEAATTVATDSLASAGGDALKGATGGAAGAAGGLGAGVVSAGKNMIGGIANSLVGDLFGGGAGGKVAGGVAQAASALVSKNPMDVIQGVMGVVDGLFGDNGQKAKIKAIEENNRKIKEAVADFNFEVMMNQLTNINSGIRLVAENVATYGLKGAFRSYMDQMGGKITGSSSQTYVERTEKVRGGLFRRSRRVDHMGAVTESMSVSDIGKRLGAGYEGIADGRISGLGDLKVAFDGVAKISSEINKWTSQQGLGAGMKGDRGKKWAQAQAALEATAQVAEQLREVAKVYISNLDTFNSQLFGFTIDFLDEFGNIADDSEAIVDVIVTGWDGLVSILDDLATNMFSDVSSIGPSIYEAVLGGVSTALSRDGSMVESGEELSKLAFEFSKLFIDQSAIDEANDIAGMAGISNTGIVDLSKNKEASKIMSEMLGVMGDMKDREKELKEYAQMVSEGMLALGGDITELRPYLSIDFQLMEDQVSHYSEKYNEKFNEVKTDIFNSFMNGTDIT